MLASLIASRTFATAVVLAAASASLALAGCAAAPQRHTAYRMPNYEASVDVRAPLDGSEKPEIVARLTLTPNGN